MTSQRGGRSWLVGFFDAVGFAAVLALTDASIHGYPSTLVSHPGEVAIGVTWIWGAYSVLVLPLALITRRRFWVATLSVTGFTLGQGALWFYRLSSGGASREQAVWLLVGCAVGATALGLVAGWVARKGAAVWVVRGALVFNCVVALAASTVSIKTGPSGPLWAAPRAARVDAQPSRPNVLLVTLDTLRPDHVGAYGYPHIETPNLDAVAREGTLFERAVTHVPVTPPSHASLLTGVYPANHGLRHFSEGVGPGSGVAMLAPIMRGAGYQTGAIIASPTLSPTFGLGRGFDVYDYMVSGGWDPTRRLHLALIPIAIDRLGWFDRYRYRTASEITDSALRWVDRTKGRPFFLWVHYFDAHSPYHPPFRYRSSEFHPDVSLWDRFSPTYAYDSEIVGLDAHFGRLMEGLDSRGTLEDTLVVVVSDHGDGLGDHSYASHIHRLYEEQLRIVMMFRYPGRIPAGRRVKAQVRMVDVMPTVLEFVGLGIPAGLDGKTVGYLWSTDIQGIDRLSFSETLYAPKRALQLAAVSDGRYKLIRSMGGDRWLFDLEKDPGELENLVDQQPAEVARLDEQLERYLNIAQPEGALSVLPDDLDENLRARLRDLGYGE